MSVLRFEEEFVNDKTYLPKRKVGRYPASYTARRVGGITSLSSRFTRNILYMYVIISAHFPTISGAPTRHRRLSVGISGNVPDLTGLTMIYDWTWRPRPDERKKYNQ